MDEEFFLQLKQILENSYSDGISDFEDVKVEDGKIIGIFTDVINSKLTKRYEFSVSPELISYQMLNPEDIDEGTDYEEADSEIRA